MIRSQPLLVFPQAATFETPQVALYPILCFQLYNAKLFVVAYRSKCLGISLFLTTSVCVSLSVPVLPIVAETGFAAGEDVSTCANHVLCPCKLLTVKNKGLPVFVKSFLAVSALFSESLDAILLVLNFLVIVVNPTVVLLINVLIILLDVPVVVLDAHLEVLHIVCEPDNLLSERFKGNQNVRSFVDIVLIIRLNYDILTEVKVMDCGIVILWKWCTVLDLSFSGERHSSESRK